MAGYEKLSIQSVAYLRTSSAANVGSDKDSEKRQREAINRFAKASDYYIKPDDWFYDEAVSGADDLMTRPGFIRLLQRIEGNGVRTVIIEDASRFARDLIVQETGIKDLRSLGVTVLTSTGDDLTNSDDPGRKMIRQVMGSFAEYEKARLVGKLAAARQRIIDEHGRCGGRQPFAVTHPAVVALAKRLHRANPVTGKRRSLREIAAMLAEAGHFNGSGKPYNAKSVKSMIDGPTPVVAKVDV